MTTQTIILKEAELAELITSTIINIHEQRIGYDVMLDAQMKRDYGGGSSTSDDDDEIEVPDEVWEGNYGNQEWETTSFSFKNSALNYTVDYSRRRAPQQLEFDAHKVVPTDGYLGYPDVSKKKFQYENSKIPPSMLFQ